MTNLYAFRDAGIPYARNYDASFCATYGGEHMVDVVNIFTDFDDDPCDPASYDFALTDEYLKVIDFAGVKTFYRLGFNRLFLMAYLCRNTRKKYGGSRNCA